MGGGGLVTAAAVAAIAYLHVPLFWQLLVGCVELELLNKPRQDTKMYREWGENTTLYHKSQINIFILLLILVL